MDTHRRAADLVLELVDKHQLPPALALTTLAHALALLAARVAVAERRDVREVAVPLGQLLGAVAVVEERRLAVIERSAVPAERVS